LFGLSLDGQVINSELLAGNRIEGVQHLKLRVLGFGLELHMAGEGVLALGEAPDVEVMHFHHVVDFLESCLHFINLDVIRSSFHQDLDALVESQSSRVHNN